MSAASVMIEHQFFLAKETSIAVMSHLINNMMTTWKMLSQHKSEKNYLLEYNDVLSTECHLHLQGQRVSPVRN
jgi:hypothetical protein